MKCSFFVDFFYQASKNPNFTGTYEFYLNLCFNNITIFREYLLMLEKIILIVMVCLLKFENQRTKGKEICILLFLTICFVLKMKFNPYFFKKLNELNFYCYSFLLSSLFYGIIVAFSEEEDTLNYIFFLIIFLLYAKILAEIMISMIFVEFLVNTKFFKCFPSCIKREIEKS